MRRYLSFFMLERDFGRLIPSHFFCTGLIQDLVLNLLTVDEINSEYMLERSFYKFQDNSAILDLEESQYLSIVQCIIDLLVEVKVLEAKRDTVTIYDVLKYK